MSTSFNLLYKEDYDSNGKRKYVNDVVIFIKVPQNYSGIYVEFISKRNEYEFILPKNLTLGIESVINFVGLKIMLTQIVDF